MNERIVIDHEKARLHERLDALPRFVMADLAANDVLRLHDIHPAHVRSRAAATQSLEDCRPFLSSSDQLYEYAAVKRDAPLRYSDAQALPPHVYLRPDPCLARRESPQRSSLCESRRF